MGILSCIPHCNGSLPPCEEHRQSSPLRLFPPLDWPVPPSRQDRPTVRPTDRPADRGARRQRAVVAVPPPLSPAVFVGAPSHWPPSGGRRAQPAPTRPRRAAGGRRDPPGTAQRVVSAARERERGEGGREREREGERGRERRRGRERATAE